MERKWWTLIAVNVAMFMLLLDITVVNTALPAIQDDLDASFTDLQWVIDGYSLTLAALVLTAGSLADRFGRRRVFVWGLGIFTVASLLCGISGTPTVLNLSRALQGVGAAAMWGCSLALIVQEFRGGKERGTALGLYGATIGAAVAIGPLVGGALTDGISWEYVFFINIPIGIAAMAVTIAKVAESRDPNATGIDYPGVVTFSAGLFALVLALLRGNEEGWGSPLIISLFAAAGVLLAAFIVIERRVREPMLPLHFFSIPSFTGAQVAAFAISGSQFAMFLYITLYLQNILGLTPFEAGLRYLPITIASFIVAPIAGSLIGRVQSRYMLSLGLLLCGIGLILMSGLDQGSEWTALLAGFLVGGAGIGLVNPVVADAAVSTVPDEQSGMATGINDVFRQVGVSVGIAVWGAIFLGRGEAEIAELAAGTPAAAGDAPQRLIEATSSGNLDQVLQAAPPASRDQIANAATEGFLTGFNEILLLAGGLGILGAIGAFFLIRQGDLRHGEQEVGEAVPGPAPA